MREAKYSVAIKPSKCNNLGQVHRQLPWSDIWGKTSVTRQHLSWEVCGQRARGKNLPTAHIHCCIQGSECSQRGWKIIQEGQNARRKGQATYSLARSGGRWGSIQTATSVAGTQMSQELLITVPVWETDWWEAKVEDGRSLPPTRIVLQTLCPTKPPLSTWTEVVALISALGYIRLLLSYDTRYIQSYVLGTHCASFSLKNLGM